MRLVASSEGGGARHSLLLGPGVGFDSESNECGTQEEEEEEDEEVEEEEEEEVEEEGEVVVVAAARPDAQMRTSNSKACPWWVGLGRAAWSTLSRSRGEEWYASSGATT